MQLLLPAREKIKIVELEPFFRARLPLPPSINRTYQPVKRGRTGLGMALTEEATLFKQMARAMLSNPDCDWSVVNAIRASQNEIQVPLLIDMDFYFSSDRRDADSGIKIAQDAVFFRLDLDDVLIKGIRVWKEVDTHNPRLEVSVRCLLISEK